MKVYAQIFYASIIMFVTRAQNTNFHIVYKGSISPAATITKICLNVEELQAKCLNTGRPRLHDNFTECYLYDSCFKYLLSSKYGTVYAEVTTCIEPEKPPNALVCYKDNAMFNEGEVYPYCCVRLLCIVIVNGTKILRTIGQPGQEFPDRPWTENVTTTTVKPIKFEINDPTMYPEYESDDTLPYTDEPYKDSETEVVPLWNWKNYRRQTKVGNITVEEMQRGGRFWSENMTSIFEEPNNLQKNRSTDLEYQSDDRIKNTEETYTDLWTWKNHRRKTKIGYNTDEEAHLRERTENEDLPMKFIDRTKIDHSPQINKTNKAIFSDYPDFEEAESLSKYEKIFEDEHKTETVLNTNRNTSNTLSNSVETNKDNVIAGRNHKTQGVHRSLKNPDTEE